jgi:hypothetical protein
MKCPHVDIQVGNNTSVFDLTLILPVLFTHFLVAFFFPHVLMKVVRYVFIDCTRWLVQNFCIYILSS